MEPEGLVRLFMLSASLGLGIYLIERVVLPLVAMVRSRQDAEEEQPNAAGDEP